MKIGIDARMYSSQFTGIGRYTYELIHHLAQMDTENEYVIFLRAEEYDAFCVPNPRVRKVLADFPHYSLGEQIGFWKVLKREKLDLMHFTHFNAPILYRGAYVVTIHDLTLSYFPGKKMTRFFHRLAYQLTIRNVARRTKKVIAVSHNTAQDLKKLLQVPASKIQVIYHGIDPHFNSALPADIVRVKQLYGLLRPYFLYTGVWRDHKNIVGMLQAFSLFLKKVSIPFDLAITGKENPYYPEVKEAIAAWGLTQHVRLTDLVPEADLKALYSGAFAYVFPSFYEGFGFPPLEAMQCGVPVIASNTSSIPEVCGEGNAVFFDPYDPSAMADCMQRIAVDETLRQQLIVAGKAHVRLFKWDGMAKAVLALYSQILHAND